MMILYLYLGFMLLLVLVSGNARAQKANQTNNLPIMKMRIGQTCDYSVFHCILPPGAVDCYAGIDMAILGNPHMKACASYYHVP